MFLSFDKFCDCLEFGIGFSKVMLKERWLSYMVGFWYEYEMEVIFVILKFEMEFWFEYDMLMIFIVFKWVFKKKR